MLVYFTKGIFTHGTIRNVPELEDFPLTEGQHIAQERAKSDFEEEAVRELRERRS
jgi:hypothetical protein